MHKAKWTNAYPGAESFLSSFRSDVPYTAKMLTEDLLEAGVKVLKVCYEEDADVGMKYHGGELSDESFINEYDSLRRSGMGGMDYSIHCVFGSESFVVGIADDSHGNSHNIISFRNASPESAYKIAGLMKKI